MDTSQGSAEASASRNLQISQLSESQTQCYIYKVHKHLRNINNEAYDPQIIAIGPYHHGNKDTYMMEKHKLRYLDELLLRNNQDFEQYTSVVEKLEKRARDCYAEPICLGQAEFIEMLVLDGCFIIELIRRCDRNDAHYRDPIFRMHWMWNSLLRDLILFENQIPFFVLCELYDLIEAPNQHNRLIYLILRFFQGIYPGAVRENRTDRDSGEIKHLLDLIHTNWRPSFDARNNDVCVDVEADSIRRLDRESRFICSATELMDANVTFSKRASNTLFDVIFENGAIVMPPLTIKDRTECFFRNLIAYEQYFPDSRMNFVTEYVRLLDCLINSAGDVKVLSECGIIDNSLVENEAAASIFNRLLDSVTFKGHFMYAGMMDGVNQHRLQFWNHTKAVLLQRGRVYFNNPWPSLTFVSALFFLFLTVAQVVLSALQLAYS